MGVLADQDMIMFADSANTIPYWVGMGVEMFYPGTPIASGAKMLGKGAARATRAGAQTVRKPPRRARLRTWQMCRPTFGSCT